jgi:O-acetyl-ADP-ribose deacetylase (regulator of RNase III)
MGEFPDELARSYRNSLRVGVANGATSIAFCCISTGIYGYPNVGAAQVALRTIRCELDALDSAPDAVLPTIMFCLFLDVDVNVYKALTPAFFGRAAD